MVIYTVCELEDNIAKMLIFLILIYKLKIPIKFLARCFIDTSKLILKFIWKGKKLNSQNKFAQEQDWSSTECPYTLPTP